MGCHRRSRSQHGRRTVVGTALRHQFGTGRGGHLGPGRGDQRPPQNLRKTLRDKRYAGAASDGGHRGELRGRDAVPVQCAAQRVDEEVQISGDEAVQFGAGHPDRGVPVGQRGRRLGRQPFLGHPALFAQPCQRRDMRRPAGFGLELGQHVLEQCAVDGIAGERVDTDRADSRETGRRVGERDAGAAGAEVTQRDDAVRRQSWAGLQRGQRRGRVGDHAQVWDRGAERRDDGVGPVGGHRDGCDIRSVVGPHGTGEFFDRGGGQGLGTVDRSVGEDHRHRVADALHEAGHRQPGGQGQRRAPDRRPAVGDRDQGGCAQ